jgi:outer membrane protein assembly factor BamB
VVYSFANLRTTAALLLGLFSVGCHHTRFGPPLIVPATTSWLTPLDEAIEGPLATDGARIFVATRSAVRALDPMSGKVLWRVATPPGQLAATVDLVVLREPDGTVTGFDPETGTARWTAASGIVGTLGGVQDRELVLVAGDGLAAFDSATGRILWSGGEERITAPPTIAGSRVLLGEGDGTLRCRDRATGRTLWTYKTQGSLLAAPLVDEQRRVFLGTTDRRILALSLDTGKRQWQWRVGADVEQTGVVHASLVLFVTFEDVLYALKRGNGNMDFRALLPSRPASAPLLFGTAVLVACREDEIVGFDTKTGVRIGSFRTPSEIRTPPVLLTDRAYVGLRNPWSVISYRLNMIPGPPLQKPLAAPKRGRRP